LPIIARKPKSNYAPAPEGQQHAVCCDVVDLGMVTLKGYEEKGPAHRIEIRWQTEARDPQEDKRFMVRRNYKVSLHEKAALRQMLESWLDMAFTDAEAEGGFDVETLVGRNAKLTIKHKIIPDGRVFANVYKVAEPDGKKTKLTVENYTREGSTPNPWDQEEEPEDAFGG
jgi:hypothetical protein